MWETALRRRGVNAARRTHVYGPVPSRRLGRSLGVDLVPFKTCTYDCLYCQLGRTTRKTVQRRTYVPVDEILADLDRALEAGPAPDYICLAGSGEPTLHAGIGEVIRAIKRRTRFPLAVLTNGSLLWEIEVRDSLMEADLVLPSLDAGDRASFQYVNRPHAGIPFERIIEGLIAFRKFFPGPVWLEVFLIAGATGTILAADRIADQVHRIQPDRIQLNTVTRPPAEGYVFPVPVCLLESIRSLFGRRAEVIADFSGTGDSGPRKVPARLILSLLARRPCTLEDLAKGLGVHPMEAAKRLESLHKAGRIRIEQTGERLFYCATVPGGREA